MKTIESDSKAKGERKNIISEAATTSGDMGKDSRNYYILQPRKGIETSSNSFSTLALIFRL